MYRLSSGSLCALSVLAGFVAVCALVPGGRLSERVSGPVQELFGLDLTGSQPSEQLEAARKLALTRTQARLRTAQALAAGRLSLLEAGARVREFDLAAPVFRWQDFRAHFPGDSDEERFCRKAIEYAVGLRIGQPERARALRQRLERELRQALRRGPLRLPPATKG